MPNPVSVVLVRGRHCHILKLETLTLQQWLDNIGALSLQVDDPITKCSRGASSLEPGYIVLTCI